MTHSDPHLLWTAETLTAALGQLLSTPIESDTPLRVTGLSIDTRDLHAGDLFVALRGEHVDGHAFVAQALEAGAAGAMVEQGHVPDDTDAPLVIVTNVMDALEALARAARQRSQAYVIGVTGSVGKTSVKETLHLALQKSGTVHVSEKSFNNHIGVPLSLARLPAEADYAVFEIGMNHAGEIAALVDMVQPHCAIITHIGEAHIENFASMDALAQAKAEIMTAFSGDGVVLLPGDNAYLPVLQKAAAENNVANVLTFGMAAPQAISDTHAAPDKVKLHAQCSCVSAHILGIEVTYKIGVPGAHHVSNSLAVLSAVSLAGADVALAALSLAGHEALSGRGRRHYLQSAQGAYELIDETYNANPVSMTAALQTLGLSSHDGHGRRIAVLGDMAELGADAPALHADLAQVIAQAEIDLVFGCGPLTKHLMDALPAPCRGHYTATPDQLVDILTQEIHRDDVVMVKGSNASNMHSVIRGLRAVHQPTSSVQMMREG